LASVDLIVFVPIPRPDLSEKKLNFEDSDEDKDEHNNKPKQIYDPKRMD